MLVDGIHKPHNIMLLRDHTSSALNIKSHIFNLRLSISVITRQHQTHSHTYTHTMRKILCV
jgi:hypothetical protein